MNIKDSHGVDIELEGDGGINIYDDAPIIAYLQANEFFIWLTLKEQNHVVHRAKWLKWESNSFLHMWAYTWMWVVFRLE